MTPATAENLTSFLKAFHKFDAFFLMPAQLPTSSQSMPEIELELAVLKRHLHIRPAWQIGENDPDIVALDEDEEPCAAVLPTVQLDIQRAVGPGDPDHRKDDRELDDAPAGHVRGEMVGRLADDRDVDEVVEELEWGRGAVILVRIASGHASAVVRALAGGVLGHLGMLPTRDDD
jgi:hypothetical protein